MILLNKSRYIIGYFAPVRVRVRVVKHMALHVLFFTAELLHPFIYWSELYRCFTYILHLLYCQMHILFLLVCLISTGYQSAVVSANYADKITKCCSPSSPLLKVPSQ